MDNVEASPCRTCGKDDFYPVGLSATTEPLFIMLGFLKSVMVQSRVCLACGTITSAVDAKAANR